MWLWEAFYLEDPCELTFANTLLLSNAAISLGNAFINLEISSEYIIFFTLWSFFLSSLFISLQIKEFRILALSINDSLYSSLFFFLTGLHFFHLSIGLILLIYFYYFGGDTSTPPPSQKAYHKVKILLFSLLVCMMVCSYRVMPIQNMNSYKIYCVI